MNENRKKQLGEVLLTRMGVTEYEEYLKSQGLPPKGDGPKIVSAAFKLYGPPLSRVDVTNSEKQVQSRKLTKLGVNVEYTLNLLRGIVEEFTNPLTRPPSPAKNKAQTNDFAHTGLKMTLFNAVIKNDTKVNLIDDIIKQIQPPFTKRTYTNGYTLELISVTGRSGRFKKLFELSKEYFVTENIGREVYSVDFKVRISKEGGRTQAASLTIYANGVIRVSGGYLDVVLGEKNTNNSKLQPLIEQPEMIRKYIINNYTKKELFPNKRFEFNNIAGVFKINRKVIIDKTVNSLGGISKFVYFLDEISPPLLRLKMDDFTLRTSVAGIIQLKGIKKPDDVVKIFNQSLDTIKDKFVLGVEFKNFNKREYTLSKMARRVNNKPAPNVARRGTTCPVGRRPEPYSFQGKCPCKLGKCFVKPNPQGQPCCYKVPKKITYSKNIVKNLYNKANVKVPQNVKNRFAINNNNGNKSNNVGVEASNITVFVDPKVGLKINSRQCSRYTRVALVDIAKRLGILSIKPKASKEELCAKIQDKAQNMGMNKTNEVSGRLAVTVNNKVIMGEGRNLKIGRRRCATYDKKDLLSMARKIGLVTVDASMSKPDICEEFEKFAERKRKEKENNLVRSRRERAERIRRQTENDNRRVREREEQLQKERMNNVMERLGITSEIIRKELPQLYGRSFVKKYGKFLKPYIEPQTGLMLNTLQKYNFELGTRGFPLKANVTDVKKNLVDRWKTVLEPEFHKMTIFPNNNAARANLRKLIGVNKEITNEILNSYKKSVLRAAIEKNNRGNFANKNKIQRAKNSWKYVQSRYGLLKSPSPPKVMLSSAEKRRRGINFEEI